MIARLRVLRRALNEGPYEASGTWHGRRWTLNNRGPSSHMGRFGGGWNRKVGIQIGTAGTKGAVIVNLWKSYLRIDPR